MKSTIAACLLSTLVSADNHPEPQKSVCSDNMAVMNGVMEACMKPKPNVMQVFGMDTGNLKEYPWVDSAHAVNGMATVELLQNSSAYVCNADHSCGKYAENLQKDSGCRQNKMFWFIFKFCDSDQCQIAMHDPKVLAVTDFKNATQVCGAKTQILSGKAACVEANTRAREEYTNEFVVKALADLKDIEQVTANCPDEDESHAAVAGIFFVMVTVLFV